MKIVLKCKKDFTVSSTRLPKNSNLSVLDDLLSRIKFSVGHFANGDNIEKVNGSDLNPC